MEILKGNLTVAVDQAMAKLDSLLLLKGNHQVSEGRRVRISGLKDTLLVSFENDLKTLVKEFKNSNDGTLSEVEQYEFSELVKAKWESTLATELETFSNEALPGWVKSVVHVWKGVENVVVDKIKKFKQAVSRSYPRSQSTCSLPRAILVGSNQIATSLAPLKDGGIGKRGLLLNILQFVGAIIEGILLMVASVIIITLYFVAYLVGAIVVGVLGLFGALDK